MLNDGIEYPDAVARRAAPLFFIADATGVVLLASPALAAELLQQATRALCTALQVDANREHMWLERIDARTVLRLLPLRQGERRVYAAFIEYDKRDGVGTAVKRFGITRREREVLEALVAGLSNPAIAKQLFITEATVGEHVKSLLKKTRANKRSEMIARIFHDQAPNKPPHGSVSG